MTIKINIIKTTDGYEFRNSGLWDYPVVAAIREGRNKPGIYLWKIIDEDKWGFHNLAGAMGRVKANLTLIAADILGCDIEFINIDNNK